MTSWAMAKLVRLHLLTSTLCTGLWDLGLNQPGDSRSLWSAVKIAKDIGTNDIPRNMTREGVSIAEDNLC